MIVILALFLYEELDFFAAAKISFPIGLNTSSGSALSCLCDGESFWTPEVFLSDVFFTGVSLCNLVDKTLEFFWRLIIFFVFIIPHEDIYSSSSSNSGSSKSSLRDSTSALLPQHGQNSGLLYAKTSVVLSHSSHSTVYSFIFDPFEDFSLAIIGCIEPLANFILSSIATDAYTFIYHANLETR